MRPSTIAAPTAARRRAALRLATSAGRAPADPSRRPMPGLFGAAEAPMVVSFEGLTEAQQRRALATFPGGRRFALGPTRL
jgi:hypothetical protein